MWYHDSMMIPYHIRYHYIKLSFFVYWYCGTCRSCVLLHFIVVQTGCGVWCKDEGHSDTPQRSIELVGLLLDHGRSHFSVCNTFHWHVRWQAYRQAHDRREGPSQDFASDFALSAPRSHSSRGMQHIFLVWHIDDIARYRIIHHVVYYMLVKGQICQCSRWAIDSACMGWSTSKIQVIKLLRCT